MVELQITGLALRRRGRCCRVPEQAVMGISSKKQEGYASTICVACIRNSMIKARYTALAGAEQVIDHGNDRAQRVLPCDTC